MALGAQWDTRSPGDQGRYLALAIGISTKGLQAGKLGEHGFLFRTGRSFDEIGIVTEVAEHMGFSSDPIENLEGFARELSDIVRFKEA